MRRVGRANGWSARSAQDMECMNHSLCTHQQNDRRIPLSFRLRGGMNLSGMYTDKCLSRSRKIELHEPSIDG